MTIEHKDIADPNIHEPKGVATASANQVYVANGAGSGSWQAAPNNVPSPAGLLKGRVATTTGANAAGWSEKVWKDLVGDITPKTSGVGAPSLSVFRGGNVRGFAYSVGDDGDMTFHLPHDYAPGTDIYLHVHWSHNGTAISGSFSTTYYASYAKGHGQAPFSSEVTGTISAGGLNLTNTPQYMHRVDEILLSSTSPTGSQLNTSLLEPDGVILLHYDVAAIPTITGGTPNEPFIFMIDIHYQSDFIGTANKTPNFYF